MILMQVDTEVLGCARERSQMFVFQVTYGRPCRSNVGRPPLSTVETAVPQITWLMSYAILTTAPTVLL